MCQGRTIISLDRSLSLQSRLLVQRRFQRPQGQEKLQILPRQWTEAEESTFPAGEPDLGASTERLPCGVFCGSCLAASPDLKGDLTDRSDLHGNRGFCQDSQIVPLGQGRVGLHKLHHPVKQAPEDPGKEESASEPAPKDDRLRQICDAVAQAEPDDAEACQKAEDCERGDRLDPGDRGIGQSGPGTGVLVQHLRDLCQLQMSCVGMKGRMGIGEGLVTLQGIREIPGVCQVQNLAEFRHITGAGNRVCRLQAQPTERQGDGTQQTENKAGPEEEVHSVCRKRTPPPRLRAGAYNLAMTSALEVEGLSKSFRLYNRKTQSLLERLLMGRVSAWRPLEALHEVSFTVKPGTLLGLIGRNGSGKSTLLKVLSGIYVADRGHYRTAGRMAGLLELGAGFHPELTGRENIFLNGSILGIPARTIRQQFDRIVEFSGLEDFLDTPIRAYSSGMVVRLGFSVAMAAEPEILLVDEVLGVGDTAFAVKSVETIREFVRNGHTVIFVSHDLPLVTELSDRVLWLEGGQLRGEGEPANVVKDYLNLLRHQDISPSTVTSATGEMPSLDHAPIIVERLQLWDINGHESTLFNTGDPANLYVNLRALHAPKDAYIQLSVRSLQGETLLGPITVPLPEFVEGSTGGAFRFHRLPLNKGEYLIAVEVWDRNLLERYTPKPALLRFTIGRSSHPGVTGPWEIPGDWEWS